MLNQPTCTTLICGKLAQETIINLERRIFVNKPGGSLIYTAYSHRLWRQPAALAARVGESFPEAWIKQVQANNFNTGGVSRLPVEIDSRSFYFLIDEDNYRIDNPQKCFAELKQPFPKTLLGYTPPSQKLDMRKGGSPNSLRFEDIPQEVLDCQFVYLCPHDFITHSLLPPLLRSLSHKDIILNPAQSYMHASFWYDVPAVFRGNTAIITTERRAKALFLGRSQDTWEMAESMANCGVEMVVITAGKAGQYLFIHSNREKFHIPAYPVKVIDPIGANDAFGGGFLAGYSLYFDPLLATMMGNISASVKVEGSTADYLLHALPQLCQARLEHIKEKIRKI